MIKLHRICVLIATAALLCSCSGGGPAANIGATRGIESIESEMMRSDAEVPSVAQYQETRQAFLERMQEVLAEHERKTGSKVGKIKNIIATVGIALGLGGTVAGLIVDDEDTQKTIAQVSASVAGVSGALGLLPIGTVPKGSVGIQKYLTLQLPAFRERWPGTLAEPMTPAQWRQFVADARQMESVVEELAR